MSENRLNSFFVVPKPIGAQDAPSGWVRGYIDQHTQQKARNTFLQLLVAIQRLNLKTAARR